MNLKMQFKRLIVSSVLLIIADAEPLEVNNTTVLQKITY